MKRAIATVLAAVALVICAGLGQATTTPAAASIEALTPVMPVGDSLTWGWTKKNGVAVVENGYRDDLWWRLYRRGKRPNMVGSCPDQRPERNCPVGTNQMGDNHHEGHSGWTTAQLQSLVPIAVTAYQPRVALLLTGANDLRLNVPTAQYEIDLAKLVDDMHAARPETHVFVGTPTFKGGEPDWDDYIQAVARVVKARPWTSLVPLHIIGQKPGELVDGVHPSPCGYARIAYVWYYWLGRSRMLNPSGVEWPTEYFPFNRPTTGVCKGIA